MAADRQIKFAAQVEDGIAQRLELQAPHIGPPEQPVVRILFRVGGIVAAALLIRGGEEDDFVQLLQRPSFLHESRGEIIEQFRMAWRRGLVAQIVGRADQSLSEMMQPETINQHARGERVVSVRDCLREFESAAAAAERRTVRPGQYFQESARHNVAMVLSLSANKDRRILRSQAVLQDHRAGRRARMHHLQHVALFAQSEHLRALADRQNAQRRI